MVQNVSGDRNSLSSLAPFFPHSITKHTQGKQNAPSKYLEETSYGCRTSQSGLNLPSRSPSGNSAIYKKILANHEKNRLDNCPTSFKPLYFRRYVDGCFISFRSQEHVQPFLVYLNRKHENINFSCELETNGSLPFLNVSIQRSNGSSTSVYRKPTFIDPFTNSDSFIPLSFKSNLFYCLLDRYFKICSSYQVFHLEVLQLKNLLLRNGYPSAFFEHCLGVFLDKIFSVPVYSPLDNINKRVIYFCLPFTGTHSLRIRTQLVKLLSSCFPDIDLLIVFKPSRRLSDFFQFKDVIPKLI